METLTRTALSASTQAASVGGQRKVAYVVSRFPKLTETFILFEMLALEQQGVQVELYPLMRARNTTTHPEGAGVWAKFVERFRRSQGEVVMHPEARSFVERAHFAPFISGAILWANLHYLFHKPQAYGGALWTLLRANWGSPNYLLGGLALFPKLALFARQMEAQGIPHLHAHFANHPAAAAFIIHRLTGIPYSFTAHGADLQVDQHMLHEKVAEAAFTVTISHYNRDFIAQVAGEAYRHKILVIRCGVDTQVFQPVDVQAGLPPFSILCTGTLYEVKGQTYLVEACRLLHERGVDFECNFIGDGPDLIALTNQVARAGLSDRVRFLGRRNRAEIAEQLRRADVVSVPSVPTTSGRREGIPVVLMEAMGSGIPVVASGISGIPELVRDGENGLLVPPRDPAQLAQALERLHRDPSLRHLLGQAGRATVLQEFDLQANAARLAQHFTTTGN